jgi:hypothetical protein
MHTVTISIFARSGHFIGAVSYPTEYTSMEKVLFQVNCMREDGTIDGLPVGHQHGDVYLLIDVAAPWGYPQLVLPPMLKHAVREFWLAHDSQACALLSPAMARGILDTVSNGQ